MMMSHASSNSRPPPTATPLTAAMVGLGLAAILEISVVAAKRKAAVASLRSCYGESFDEFEVCACAKGATGASKDNRPD